MSSKLVPKVRFKEFSGEWEEKRIGDIGHFYYGKSAPKWSLDEKAPTKCVRYGELYTKFGATITETYSRTNIDPEKLKFSKGGEILVPRVGERPEEFGKCCSYLPLKNIAIGEMISVFNTKQNPLFYTYYFRNMWAEFSKVVEGQNVKNLYYKELEPLKIYQPILLEQQKIADTFSSLDNLIEVQTKKVELLKSHKKGLMQKLFPRDGAKVPEVRFKEFSGEWKKEKISEIIDVIDGDRGKNYPKENDFSNNDYCLFLNAKNVTKNGFVFDTLKFISKNKDNLMTKGKLKPFDIVLTTRGTLGNFAYFTEDIPFKNIRINSGMVILRKKSNKLLSNYIYYFFKTEFITNSIKNMAFGNAQQQLTLINIKKQIIYFSKDTQEQQKIANTFSSLDNLIEAQTKKIELLKEHKKGLMQKMFVGDK